MSKKNITIDEVKRIAKLSKLEISDSDLNYYAEEMDKIINYFNILSEVDTSGVSEMTHVTDTKNVTREDESGECVKTSEVIDNCPESNASPYPLSLACFLNSSSQSTSSSFSPNCFLM